MKKIILASLVLTLTGSAALAGERYRVRVDGMTCPFCVNKTEKALRGLSGVKTVSANLGTGVISVCAANAAQLTSSKVRQLVTSAGFTFRSLKKTGRC